MFDPQHGWQRLAPDLDRGPYIDHAVATDAGDHASPKIAVANGVWAGVAWSLVMFEKPAMPNPDELQWARGRSRLPHFEFYLGGTRGVQAALPGGFGGFGSVADLAPSDPHLRLVNSSFDEPESLQFLVVLTSRDVSTLAWSADGHSGTAAPYETPEPYPTATVFVTRMPEAPLDLTALDEAGVAIGASSVALLTERTPGLTRCGGPRRHAVVRSPRARPQIEVAAWTERAGIRPTGHVQDSPWTIGSRTLGTPATG